MTPWPYRMFIFQKHIALANALWTVIAPERHTERLTFGNIRLSENGLEPVTCHAANTAATDQMKLLIQHFAPDLPHMIYYVLNPDSILLEAHNTAAPLGHPWSWHQALHDLQLQLIQEVY